MMYPLVRDLAGDGVPVTVTCRVLKISRQPYYRWLDSPVTDAELDEAWLANAIFDAHRDDPEFGYRFLADEVRAGGFEVSDRRVWRICRDIGRRERRRPGTLTHSNRHRDPVRTAQR
jgi:putative transposase